jgi:UDP-glucose 4-epimerase
MRCIVTGCAGFVGSSMVDRLLSLGHTVIGIDNFSTGNILFLSHALNSSLFTLIKQDITDPHGLRKAFSKGDFVFHFAANADVRHGIEYPYRDLQQNTIATYNVLEAMRANGIKNIVFSSTGSVYGDATVIPTPEDAPFPVQTSLYAASKLAGEGLITAYAEGFDFKAHIFRFVSILGERYTHGHVFDFVKSLLKNPSELTVLGNGKQRKSYLYIQDCIDAMLLLISKSTDKVTILNLGTDEYCEILDSIGWITNHLDVSPHINLTGGDRGWVGDNPFIYLDTTKIRNIGWEPKVTIKQGIIKTVDYLKSNPWVFERE